ncbi:hypothetical protein KPSB59_2750007 [Klebsiella quasipneumoniae subsp. quasipneumoniae]|nr:hypothetical protein KPSB59_2750007 [Klebsiella quasipneumoniae subsp. quasipneumoniae]HBR0482747.1 hypothetical protein [Klebsiella pneumoniae]
MKYPGWFVEAVKDLLSWRMLEDIAYGVVCLLFLITLPVSLPIITAIRMLVTKRKLRKEYGHDELMRDD